MADLPPGAIPPVQTPTTGQPNVVLGVLQDVQIASLALKGIAIDTPINRIKPKQPTGLNKILADMGFTANNLQEGFSKANFPVQQASISDITGPSFGGGGGFVSSMPSRGDDFGVA